MAFTQAQIDALEKAIAEGTTRVKYQDREVTYRSLEEMLQILSMMKNSLDPTSGQIKVIRPEFSKGLS